MYIKELKIENIKLIREMKLHFSRAEELRMWTVFVGENGLCKTSILQAIALAALGADRANGFQEIIPSLPDRRKKRSTVTIEGEFQFGPVRNGRRIYPGVRPYRATHGRVSDPSALRSSVKIRPGWSLFLGGSSYLYQEDGTLPEAADDPPPNEASGPDPLKEARGMGLPFWFVAGYGTARSLPLPFSTERIGSPGLERLASLFDRGRIVGTGFADILKSKLVKPYARSYSMPSSIKTGLCRGSTV